MIIENKKILVLAPHTDDAELGCGGTIAKLIKNNEVYCVAFSTCKQSVPKGFPEDVLVSEIKASMEVLGVKPENLILLDYDVRTFNYHRQKILDDMIRLKKDIEPDIVFIPSLNDVHQDHSTIAKEALRAFKFKTIFCYEMPWNNFEFKTSCFFELTDEDIMKKVNAMGMYKSQNHRNYSGEDFLKSLALVRGVQIGKKYAETFEVIRIIL